MAAVGLFVLWLGALVGDEDLQPSPNPDPGPMASPLSPEYSYDYEASGSLPYATPSDCAAANCKDEFLSDGECDRVCNNELCDWDHGDCDHDGGECYTHLTGADYRGNVSWSASGIPCQFWSSQWPNKHTYTMANYPDARLGGHNSCRNPDPTDGSTGPWCILDSYTKVWEYCDVGPPSTEPCPVAHPLIVHNVSELHFGEWREDGVREHEYKYYSLHLPASSAGVQLVLVPQTGDADMYLSFDEPLPTGHSYSYQQNTAGVEVFRMTRTTFGFCGKAGRDAACDFYISVTGYESSRYHIVAFNLQPNASNTCAEECDWKSLGDGECQLQCNTSSCFFDRGDCATTNSSHCKQDCDPSWIGDQYCDRACYNAKCAWDGGDCGDGGDSGGCADDCLPELLGNGECNEKCNVESCAWDADDCFHDHHGCYVRSDGADYRGTVSFSRSGKVCQKWSAQYPQPHERTHAKYPTAGLGGHNFCRNPDGEAGPWCYVAGDVRFELCDVGAPSETCPPPPPPPPPRSSPRPPPPAVCPKPCKKLAHNGKCDQLCNLAACVWDHGECDALSQLAREANLSMAAVREFQSIARGEQSSSLFGGMVLGVGLTIAALCALFMFRRHRRRVAAHKQSKGLYMPYGDVDGVIDPDQVADMRGAL
ncbi:hypothetical protein AB1Y20_020168 [Prymnesium parvum]|uniref:Kringle domain-containing protein n=1 Tax=Prymnesium parvum TaxID=97485 RepID=A0AB34JW68_PRYPA